MNAIPRAEAVASRRHPEQTGLVVWQGLRRPGSCQARSRVTGQARALAGAAGAEHRSDTIAARVPSGDKRRKTECPVGQHQLPASRPSTRVLAGVLAWTTRLHGVIKDHWSVRRPSDLGARLTAERIESFSSEIVYTVSEQMPLT